MKYILNIFIFLVFTSTVAQTSLIGVWQGVLVKDGYPLEKGTLFYANFNCSNNGLSGKTRDEIFETENFAVKQIKGSCSKNKIEFSQYVIEKKKSTGRISWCNVNATLTYNDSTGYLEGRYVSNDCKNNMGRIILYQSDLKFSADEAVMSTHFWFPQFIRDFKKGYNAPKIREKERNSFVFQPIYFDYDKADIRVEYEPFLLRMIRVIDGHSDLRILVTGHTDSDGSDAYNNELSKKRAQSLIDFFVKNGLSRDRIEFDFKGETSPVDTNKTPEGKQRNRRVDFSFI